MENKDRKHKKRWPVVSLLLREKKFLINYHFQVQFMASLILVSIISMSIIYMANDYFFNSYMAKGHALNLPPNHPFFLMIHEQKAFMTKVFLVVAGSLSTIACIWGLFYSHKIAGPLYRLHRYFEEATNENRSLNKKIHFREDDFFQEIPTSINNYIDKVENLENEQNENKQKYIA